jgi:hypothetical protein
MSLRGNRKFLATMLTVKAIAWVNATDAGSASDYMLAEGMNHYPMQGLLPGVHACINIQKLEIANNAQKIF